MAEEQPVKQERLLEQFRGKKIDVLKYLPIIAPVLIFFGVTRLSFYYSQFNVNIIYYLDLPEIITQFFDVLIANAFMIGITCLWIFIMSLIVQIKSKYVTIPLIIIFVCGPMLAAFL